MLGEKAAFSKRPEGKNSSGLIEMIDHKPIIFSKARSFPPSPIKVPWHLPRILGCGAELKNTFCLGHGKSSFLSLPVGDLSDPESYDLYTESIEHLKQLLQLEPEVAACDLHPDYLSSYYAEKLNLPLYRIQHHHAHAVAVMAEHGLDGPVLAVIMDGAGYGPDNTVWGGEILKANLTSCTRLGHLSHLHLPGGDAAAIEPWRMALAALYSLSGGKTLYASQLPVSLQHLDAEDIQIIRTMVEKKFNAPLTSSCGRLFDAIAALLGICQYNSYEGQAAIELEAQAKKEMTSSWLDEILQNRSESTTYPLVEISGTWEISSQECVKMVLDGLAGGDRVSGIALRFHLWLIGSIAELVQRLSQQTRITKVVLSGGCMQNDLLLEGLLRTLKKRNLQVYTGKLLPVNDGAISFGQVIAGGLQHMAKKNGPFLIQGKGRVEPY